MTPYLITCITYDFFRAGTGKALLYSLCIVTGLLFCFEFFEYFLDRIQFFQFNTRGVYGPKGEMLMPPMLDTVLDLGIGMLAATTAVFRNGKGSRPAGTKFQLIPEREAEGVEVKYL